jgi:hypothetical protein
MIRKDYILRLIEEAARVLARIIHAKEHQRYGQALLMLQTFGRQFEPEFETLANLSDEELLALISQNSSAQAPFADSLLLSVVDVERCQWLARLYHQAAELYALLLHPDEAERAYVTTLRLLILLTEARRTSEDKAVTLNAMQLSTMQLNAMQLNATQVNTMLLDCVRQVERRSQPLSFRKRLFTALEHTGHIAVAETVLFEIVEDDHAFARAGHEFYTRLTDLSDAELERGNFSRNEIAQGIQDLFTIPTTL